MENILIIDDDIHIGNMLEETLTKEGYAVCRMRKNFFLFQTEQRS